MSVSRRLLGESSKILRSYNGSLRSLATVASESTSSPNAAAQGQDSIGAYFLLSRLPTVLPSLTPFETSMYAYNSKLERALSRPFPRDLYFKKGSAAETQFLQDEKEREEFMKRNIQIENVEETDSKGDLSNVSPSVPLSSARSQTPTLRKTKADETNDVRSLERNLERTLFLIVKGGKAGDQWTLPRSIISKKGSDSLHSAAPKSVSELLGEDMDIWMVTNYPVGIIGRESEKEKGYVMRGHILAGNPTPKTKGVDFAWLTKEELQSRLGESVWKDVKDLLSV